MEHRGGILGTNQWYTKGIVLEDIAGEQFDSYKPCWKAEGWENRNAVLCEIKQTVVDTDYKHLLLFLLKHKYADEIRVKTEDGWDQDYKSRICDYGGNIVQMGRVEDMAEKAAFNKEKSNYLEMYLKEPWIKEKVSRVRIQFSGYKGLIIATQAIIPPRLAHLFTINVNGPYPYGRFFHGILGEPNYEQLTKQDISLAHTQNAR